ncbi:cytochrome c [Neopusillimonas aromaticivorans]|uniref:cytochrome c n=1 Tax=Neopusillimonas aromaticivorans TaxID=2979868 RepID=UPI00331541B4
MGQGSAGRYCRRCGRADCCCLALAFCASPIPAIDTSIYSAAAIERGRLVALAGDCMVCHTADDGTPNAGGRPLETPFGTVYSTNITPDRKTGIGSWSYAAFERAMREGIHQDGRHLYPVFPYTAFAKLSDADMQSLYAWLMTQDPVSYTPPETRLAFPYSARPLMAGWNALFHTNEVYQPDPTQTTLWNRGAYLVQGPVTARPAIRRATAWALKNPVPKTSRRGLR